MSHHNVWEWLLEQCVFQLLTESWQQIGWRDIVGQPVRELCCCDRKCSTADGLQFECSEWAWLYGSGYALTCIVPLFPIDTWNLHVFQQALQHHISLSPVILMMIRITKWLRNRQDGSGIFRLRNHQFSCFFYAHKRPSPFFMVTLSTAEIRRGKKEEEETTAWKHIWPALLHRATITNHSMKI